MKLKKLSFIALSLIAILSCDTYLFSAAANFKLNYQGYIKSGGVPVNETKGFVFRIRDGSGGAVQWESTCTDIAVSSGIFRAVLGETNGSGIWDNIDWNGIDAYLELEIGDAGTCASSAVMSPQEKFTAVPYAFFATSATVLADVNGLLNVDASTVSVNGQDMYFVPQGLIIMWSGTIATIPAGWVLCDGANGAPDLRDKFIAGATQDDTGVAKTNVTGSLTLSGGTTTHSHTTPSHTHDLNIGSFSTSTSGDGNYGNCCRDNNDPSPANHTHTIDFPNTVSTGATPTANSSSSLSPYYALAYIMKL